MCKTLLPLNSLDDADDLPFIGKTKLTSIFYIFCPPVLSIESLSVTQPKFKLAKLKLEYLKFIFYCKKERYKHRQKFFTSLESDFFRIPLKLAFRIRRVECLLPVI